MACYCLVSLDQNGITQVERFSSLNQQRRHTVVSQPQTYTSSCLPNPEIDGLLCALRQCSNQDSIAGIKSVLSAMEGWIWRAKNSVLVVDRNTEPLLWLYLMAVKWSIEARLQRLLYQQKLSSTMVQVQRLSEISSSFNFIVLFCKPVYLLQSNTKKRSMIGLRHWFAELRYQLYQSSQLEM